MEMNIIMCLFKLSISIEILILLFLRTLDRQINFRNLKWSSFSVKTKPKMFSYQEHLNLGRSQRQMAVESVVNKIAAVFTQER